MKLTNEQARAANAPGSVSVTAGAGTGKTSMLAARYLYHVRTDELSPLSVVAVTFTDKAADELRSRIRKTLHAELGDEKVIAEVEAAQISTMHALAARICRDFYDLAGIPADFTILDETDSPLWMAEKFDQAMHGVDPTIVNELGFVWLASAIRELLRDPFASEKALALGSENWQAAIEAECEAALGVLIGSDAWHYADATIGGTQGSPGDRLEESRVAAINAMEDIRSGRDLSNAVDVLKRLITHQGKTANWPPGGKELISDSLKALKQVAVDVFERATLQFDDSDREAARRIGPLAAAFRQVRDQIAAEKLREKVLDFNDLEHYALAILKHPEAVEHYNLRWKAFLVDEFQDTNPIQAEILDRLRRRATRSVVGDEKQAIYGFRGADIGVFGRVRTEIVDEPDGIEVPLSLTFRTHHELVVTMNTIFEPVLGHLHQPLEASRMESPFEAPHLHSAVVEKVTGAGKSRQQIVEARYIADRIAELSKQGVPYRDIAVISRTWAPLDVYLGVLSANKIPAVHAGGGSLLATREALDVYALLGFLAEPNDDIPLVSLLRSPFFAVSDITLFEAATALKNGVSWWSLIELRQEFSREVEILKTLLEGRSKNSSEQLLQLADNLTGYGAVVANMPHGSRRVADLRGIQELFRKLDRQGRGDSFSTLRIFRELIESETEIPRPPLETGEAVSLMTIHKAKGLEWPIVFIPDLARDRRGDASPVLVDADIGVAFQMDSDGFEKTEPSIHKLIKMRRKERETDEARRLFYVAVTRARDKVFLSATKEKGFGLDILRPGLDAAGIVDEIIPYDETMAVAPSPGEREPFGEPQFINVEPVRVGLRDLPVTALTVYNKCPLRFKFRFVDGHPGLSQGFASAMAIGSLVHLALELNICSIDDLRHESIESSDDQLIEAVELANRYRDKPAFADVRSAECSRESRFMLERRGLKLAGVADLVGPDFVLDYKTDSEMHPEEHRFQLWAYAEAFGKSKAYLAYLRHDVLYELGTEELMNTAIEANELLDGIFNGEYEPKPSIRECGYCPFRTICSARSVGE